MRHLAITEYRQRVPKVTTLVGLTLRVILTVEGLRSDDGTACRICPGEHPGSEYDPTARRGELDRVFTDKASGKDQHRPELEALIGFVRDGGTVLVHSMDRLARNLDDLRAIVRRLTDKGVRVQFLKEHLTFTGDDTAMATLMLSVMGAFAEFERALIRERQREGITLARRNGVYKGRRKALTMEQWLPICNGCASGSPSGLRRGVSSGRRIRAEDY